ncbi:MAG: MBL fold metallo-hydrolase [Chloroflexota bacterium]
MDHSTTADFAAKQAQIDHQRAQAAEEYPRIWQRIIAEWSNTGDEDRAWLVYSANYLFRTAGLRWALDPLTLKQRIPQAPRVDVARDLSRLSLVLLTHRHADHLDLNLLRALRHLPIQWIIPEPILPAVLSQAGLSLDQVIIPRPLQPIRTASLSIIPFEGLHWEESPATGGSLRSVPAIAYLVEFNRKRWLFPGDTRTYDTQSLPSFGTISGAFVHLWLGRACALRSEPPLLDAFCAFCASLDAPRVIIAHLNEFGRDANDYWDSGHYLKVQARCQDIASQMQLEQAAWETAWSSNNHCHFR